MIVSWNWLRDYVELDASPEEVAERLTMSGLNLEGIQPVGDDFAIDLEVTSNRPDCLGHLGVAREAAVLFGKPLKIPAPDIVSRPPSQEPPQVCIEAADLCPQYTGRVIRGVKIGPSPDWLRNRLEAVGLASVNNVVDVTNYVLMECGQPLHAFDLSLLKENRIIVRKARAGETLEAIDHRTYQLTPEMCVIADGQDDVAVGGVMGGASTEISDTTTDLLIEVANFRPGSIRWTARNIRTAEGTERRKGLHSPSSYRFERGVDPRQLEWASDRCCELILQVAGGQVEGDLIVAGSIPEWDPPAVTLRFAQIERLLGISIPNEAAVSILQSLGCRLEGNADAESAAFTPPSWRRDLTRECDLIEEVARIYGYDQIPEDRKIPVIAGTPTTRERCVERIRQTLSAAGFDEALTFSFVPESTAAIFDPVPGVPLTTVEPAAGEFGNLLRKSLIPSLVAARRENERRGNSDARLYEIARVFRNPNPDDLTTQPTLIGLVTGQSFLEVRGLLDTLIRQVGAQLELRIEPSDAVGFVPGRGADLWIDAVRWGVFGELDRNHPATAALKLREPVTVAEVDLQPLIDRSQLIPQARPLTMFPAVVRDINLLLDMNVSWQQVEKTVRKAAGDLLDRLEFLEQYQGKQIPAGKKSYVFQAAYRATDRTLTSDEVDQLQAAAIEACRVELGAQLR